MPSNEDLMPNEESMSNEELMSKEDIEKYLKAVNQKLAERGKHGDIIMAGGASLTVLYNARDATHDIDAIFRPSQEFREIIKEIAVEHNLEDDWLNDGVKGFFTDKLHTDLYKQYSNLSVYSIDAEGLLALKLTSARAMSNDMKDSITLMKHLDIKNVEQLYDIVEKYTHKSRQTPVSYYFTQEAFEKYQQELAKELTGDVKPREQQAEKGEGKTPDEYKEGIEKLKQEDKNNRTAESAEHSKNKQDKSDKKDKPDKSDR